VLVVGAGFAGYHCLRTLHRRLPPEEAELVLVNPTDYLLYVPLLPEVAGGVLDPRRVAVSLRGKLPRARLMLGQAVSVDLTGQTCTTVDVEGRQRTLDWDRLVLTSGSVTRLLSIPGVAEHAKGFKSVAEAVYLRDHVLRQLELAEQATDPAERAARMTFVVVGAGYTGTELVAQGRQLTEAALRNRPSLSPALAVLRNRTTEVRLETSVTEVTATHVRLKDGTEIPTRTVVWCVGVRPDPLVEALGLSVEQGRLTVGPTLSVPGHDNVYAAGDVAAVPDFYHPGELTPMTAQHAQRQGRVAGLNLAASFGHGRVREYRHRDLGFVVDLAGWEAVADPLHVPLKGWPAKVITRGYHLLALPANRLRVATDWLTEVLARRQVVQFGLVPEQEISLAHADKPPRLERSR
jgi:NADH dehydrogenase